MIEKVVPDTNAVRNNLNTRFNDVDRSILDVKNKNKEANNRINNVINTGNDFVHDTRRKFYEQKILNDQFNRFDDMMSDLISLIL